RNVEDENAPLKYTTESHGMQDEWPIIGALSRCAVVTLTRDGAFPRVLPFRGQEGRLSGLAPEIFQSARSQGLALGSIRADEHPRSVDDPREHHRGTPRTAQLEFS